MEMECCALARPNYRSPTLRPARSSPAAEARSVRPPRRNRSGPGGRHVADYLHTGAARRVCRFDHLSVTPTGRCTNEKQLKRPTRANRFQAPHGVLLRDGGAVDRIRTLSPEFQHDLGQGVATWAAVWRNVQI